MRSEALLEAINLESELERAGVRTVPIGDGHVKICCPFHDDATPSCAVSLTKRVFHCYGAGCQKQGDALTLLAKILGKQRHEIAADLARRYDIDISKAAIDRRRVEDWHADIWNSGRLIQELRDRGLTDADLRRWRIGTDGERVTIPITDETGEVVNVRKYLPGARGEDKMRNMRGRGKVRLWPLDQLQYDRIVVCAGELKAVVVAGRLNERGWGAIATTGGEGTWNKSFSERLRGKRAYLLFDIDLAGRNAAAAVGRQLEGYATEIREAALPLDPKQFPKGDVSDYFGKTPATAEDLVRLLDGSPQWVPPAIPDSDAEPPEPADLRAAVDATLVGKRLEVVAAVSSMDPVPFMVPKTIRATCDREQTVCPLCPLFAADYDDSGSVVRQVPAESPAILAMMASRSDDQRPTLMQGLGVPTRCKSAQFVTIDHHSVQDVRVSTVLDVSTDGGDRMLQPAAFVGPPLELNAAYKMVGRVHPHPRTQYATLVISKASPQADALSRCEFSDDDLERLEIFRPSVWSDDDVAEKMDDIHADLGRNVTRIVARRDMHAVIDLTYHSLLMLRVDGKIIKGWAESLIVGDSAQGKTEAILAVMRHFGFGHKMDCKNASVAGLLGGVQQLGTRWFVTWGAIPTFDRRLVVLEELKGASTEVIGKLTDMRSSGIAEIAKIDRRRAFARTRLIALSNPRGNSPLSAYTYGIEAVVELVGSLEDVRRFDVVYVAASSRLASHDVSAELRARPAQDPKYSAAACKTGVLWAWTRTLDDVRTDRAVDACDDAARRMCDRYSEAIPIVDRGSMRLKLMRLSAACAARTFSTSDGGDVIVLPCHVRYVENLLTQLYDAPESGYLEYSTARKAADSLKDVPQVERIIRASNHPLDLVDGLLRTTSVELRDLCDWGELEPREALEALLSPLVRKNALVRDGRGYKKTAGFILLLRSIRDTVSDRKAPAFVNRDEEKV